MSGNYLTVTHGEMRVKLYSAGGVAAERYVKGIGWVVADHADDDVCIRSVLECVMELSTKALCKERLARMAKEREHETSCPRSQFWDAGEFEASCTCGR